MVSDAASDITPPPTAPSATHNTKLLMTEPALAASAVVLAPIVAAPLVNATARRRDARSDYGYRPVFGAIGRRVASTLVKP